MATFAVLSGNYVTNVIVADTIEIAQEVCGEVAEYTLENPAGIGWVYDPESGTFSDPSVTI
jgi:hypothetical protein